MSIEFDSNFLTVDGKKLRADVLPTRSKDKLAVSSEELREILMASRDRILSVMETIYHDTKRAKPGHTVRRPSIWTVELGTRRQSEGDNNQVYVRAKSRPGSVITEAEELHDGFHDHFAVIGDAGFVPEVRETTGTRKVSGSWLLLRKPTLHEVADKWLGYDVSITYPFNDDSLRGRDFKSLKPEELSNDRIGLYRRLGETVVDWLSDTYGDEERSRFQIGLLLSLAALKQTMGDIPGYRQEADDALTYADNDPSVHGSVVRAIENSVYGTPTKK